MESQVWVKVSLFLKELRCEDIKRNSIIHLESCQKEKKALKIFRQVWEKEQKNLSELQQRAICNYIEQIEYSCAMKSHFRKSGNQMSGKWKSSCASLLA